MRHPINRLPFLIPIIEKLPALLKKVIESLPEMEKSG
jgi:hypothetical protein